MDFIPSWLSPLAAALAGALSLWNFFQAPSKRNELEIQTLRAAIDLLRREVASECKSIDDKVDAIGGRVSTLEIVLRQMPDKDAQHRLELGLLELRGEFKVLHEQLRPVAAISERMQELMLAGKA